jgi:hypothetical protein
MKLMQRQITAPGVIPNRLQAKRRDAPNEPLKGPWTTAEPGHLNRLRADLYAGNDPCSKGRRHAPGAGLHLAAP